MVDSEWTNNEQDNNAIMYWQWLIEGICRANQFRSRENVASDEWRSLVNLCVTRLIVVRREESFLKYKEIED